MKEQSMEIEGLIATFEGKEPDICRYRIHMDCTHGVSITNVADNKNDLLMLIDGEDWNSFIHLLTAMTDRLQTLNDIARDPL